MLDRIKIPAPFRKEKFRLLRKGVFDDPGIGVFVNRAGDFAFLDPQPRIDYRNYKPRVAKLKLTAYKKMERLSRMRFEKLMVFFSPSVKEVMEIGAAEGSFLRVLKEKRPGIRLSCVEPDRNTLASRKKVRSLKSYDTVGEALASRTRYDAVCLFHVLEHITEPAGFLREIGQLTRQGGLVIIEVPSLFDPLLSLYRCRAYEDFYFQKQHPFVYSRRSLPALMEHHGYRTRAVLDFQRYGLENHLTWLVKGTFGGNDEYGRIFSGSDRAYAADLERSGWTDSVIWAGTYKGEQDARE